MSVFHASALRELRFLRSQLPFGLERLRTYPLALPLTCFERLAARRAASGIVALSEFSRSLLREDHGRAGERARILPAGIDLDRFSPADGVAAARTRLGVDPDAPLLVTVRRLEPRMGVEQLLRAVQRLADRRLTLVVVGRGRLDAALRSLSAELGLEREVRFVGSVPDDELGDWYRAADLFVLPTAAYEGFGMVTAEALASGTPVVGTPVGATPELLAPLDPRLVARGTDADALADAISEALALTGPEFRRRCREYASERFSLETTIAEWERALVETVDIAPGPAPPRGRGGRRTRPTSSSNASLSSTTVGPETRATDEAGRPEPEERRHLGCRRPASAAARRRRSGSHARVSQQRGNRAREDRARREELGREGSSRPELARQVVAKPRQESLVETYRGVMQRLEAPSVLGYSAAGEVIAVGADCARVRPGDLVACGGGLCKSRRSELRTEAPPHPRAGWGWR